MLQMPSGWKGAEGAGYVSSEDESWLDHPGFHLSDSEGDEARSVGLQYVQAVVAVKRASLPPQSLTASAQAKPLLLEAACKTPGGQVEPSAKEPAGQKQQTMHALEMLLPQEHHATPATELTYAKQLSLTPVNVQPVTTARTQAGHNNSLLMSPSHARTDCAQSRSIGLDSLMSPEQRLASPASQLGALPFTASKPPALTRQQQQQQQLQQGSDLPAAPGPVGLLELALSTDQIALLQTAADNAQLYLEKESSPEDEDAVAGAAAHHDWDVQTAIMEAFKTILPVDTAEPSVSPSMPAAAPAAASVPAKVTPVPDDNAAAQATPPLPAPFVVQSLTKMPEEHSVPSALHTSAPVSSPRLQADLPAGLPPPAILDKTQASSPKQKARLVDNGLSAPQQSDSVQLRAASRPAPPAAATVQNHQPSRFANTQLAPIVFRPQHVEAKSAPLAQAANAAAVTSQPTPQATAGAHAPPSTLGDRLETSSPAAPSTAGSTEAIIKAFAASIPTPVAEAAAAAPLSSGSSAFQLGRPQSIMLEAPFSASAVLHLASATAAPEAQNSAGDTAALPAAPPAASVAAQVPAALPPITDRAETGPTAASLLKDSRAAPILPSIPTLATAAVPAAAEVQWPADLSAAPPSSSHLAEASGPVPAGNSSLLASVSAASEPSVFRWPAATVAFAGLPANSTPVPFPTSSAAAAITTCLPHTLGNFGSSLPPTQLPVSVAAPFLWSPAFLSTNMSAAGTPTSLPPSPWGLTEAAATPIPFGPSATARGFAEAAATPIPFGPSATAWGFAEAIASPSLFTFAEAATSPSLFSPPPATAPATAPALAPATASAAGPATASAAAPARASAKKKASKASKKRKAQELKDGASLSPGPTETNTKESATTSAAAASGPAFSPTQGPANTAVHRHDDTVPNPKRHQPDPQPDPQPISWDVVSPELAAMRSAHGGCAIPKVGPDAVQPELAGVKSLVTSRRYTYKLTDVVEAIGEFAIGPGRERVLDIFLGDLRDSLHHRQEVFSIACLFGVKAYDSENPVRFHEKFHLTRLVRKPDAGILTPHGDMLVYFILELAELSKLNRAQGGEMYKRELKATLALANAVGRKLNDNSPEGLNKGCLLRLQQLADKGYLAVKRPKGNRHNQKPAQYPGWQGRPLYGPPTSTSLPRQPPPQPRAQAPKPHVAAATAAARPPAQATASAAALPFKPPFQPSFFSMFDRSARLAWTPPSSLQAAAPMLSTSQASRPAQTTAAGRLPPFSFGDTPVAQSASAAATAAPPLVSAAATAPIVVSGAAPVVPLSSPLSSPAQQDTASASPQKAQISSGHTHLQQQQQKQQQQVPLSDATAALVAAVGPLFEKFVAQTAAVVADPDVSLDTLAGSITQELAAAIATAAVQVVGKRRQHLIPSASNPPHNAGGSPAAASLSDAPLTMPLSAKTPASVVLGPPSDVPSSSGADASAVRDKETARAGAANFTDDTVLANDKEPTLRQQNVIDLAEGAGTAGSGLLGVFVDKGRDHGRGKVATSEHADASPAGAKLKRGSTGMESEHNALSKKHKTGTAIREEGAEHYAASGAPKDISKFDASAHDTRRSDSRSNQADHEGTSKDHRESRHATRSSPGSRSSKGSGKLSPKDPTPLHAAFQASSHRVASPLSVGRSDSGSPFQRDLVRPAQAVLPSRFSGSFGSGSPVMLPGSPVMLPGSPTMGQSASSTDFRPLHAYSGMISSPQSGMGYVNGLLPLMPASPADWPMQLPALNSFPMAAHFLPGVDESPDFSPRL